MSLTNPNTPVSQQDLQDFYNKIKPYMGLYPSAMGKKIGKGDIYSTDERMIGQWIDGKPLYQRVITGTTGATAGSSATIVSIPNISDIDSIVKVKYMLLYNGAENPTYVIEGNYYESSNYNICYWISNGAIMGIASSAYINKPVIVILDYTKTTDSAISIGDETDYSTTEKIVGTWIDGSPIWQKTISGSITTSGDGTEEIIDSSLNLTDTSILNIDGCITNSVGARYVYGYCDIIHQRTYGLVQVAGGLRIDMYKFTGATNYEFTIQYIKTT